MVVCVSESKLQCISMLTHENHHRDQEQPLYLNAADTALMVWTLFSDALGPLYTEAAALEAVQQVLRTFRDQGIQLDLKKYVPPAQHGVPFLACEVDTRVSSGGQRGL